MTRLANPRASAMAGPLGWSALSFGTKALTGVVVFVLIARHYGPTEFGIYAGTLALVALFTGFAMLGSAELAAQRVTRSPGADRHDMDRALGEIVRLCLTSLPLVLVLVSLGGAIFLPSIGAFWPAVALIAVLGLGEFAVQGVIESFNALLVAADHHREAALLTALANIGRVVAAVAIVMLGTASLMTLAVLFAVVGFAATGGGFWLMRRLGCQLIWPSTPMSDRLGDGLDLALAGASRKTLHSADQSVLLRSGYVIETGQYGVGSRIVQYAFLPAMIVLQVTYPKFFEHGKNGIGASAQFARRVAPPLVAYGLFAAVAIYLSRLLVVPVLGEEYAGAAPVLASLCLLPLIRILASLLGDVLISSGHVSSRTRPMVAAAIANLVLNLLLIPRYSWQGAVATTYIADIGVVLAYVALVRRIHRADPHPAQPDPTIPQQSNQSPEEHTANV